MKATGTPWALVLLAAAGCENSLGPCKTAADCGADQHCLVDHERGRGQCVATPGRDVPTPPLRLFADPSHTDILLVVDDGPGTVELQARLIASVDVLADQARLRNNDLRVAVTTSSAQSPICDSGNAASSGRLADRSCLDRLDDFVGADGTDAQWLCTDVCTHTSEQLGIDAEHPWLDLLRLPPTIDPADALACVVPQGIVGCEYAAPLDVVLAAAADEELRSWQRFSFLAQIVVVTDSVDCSVSAEGAAAFDPAGDRALWSDPEADAPTPAVCWNAGVECEGSPEGFDRCVSIDRALDGSEADDDPPVLVPMSEYPESGYFYWLHLIAGVPVDDPYSPPYSAAGDADWLLEHGIDPGCSDADATIAAPPPVRLLEVVDEVHSACAPDYRPVLDALVADGAVCMEACRAEAIEITYEPVGGEPVAIPACEGTHPDLAVPDGAPACMHIEADSASCTFDEISAVELRLLTAQPGHTGSFVFTPNPYAPEVEIPGCGD